MSVWTIEPLPLYRFLVPGPEVLFQRGFGEMIEMVIYAFLLESDETSVLVDTGLPPDFTALNAAIRARKGPQAGFDPLGAPLSRRLAERNVVPDAILLTSFGPYAVGGLPDFAGIPVHASARGLADLMVPEEPALLHPIHDAARQALLHATLVAGETVPWPGIAMIETGIHHPASASVVVDTAQGRIAIADPIFTRRNLVEGVPLGAAEHAAGWHGLVRLLDTRADAVIPIHDIDPTPLGRDLWHRSLEAR